MKKTNFIAKELLKKIQKKSETKKRQREVLKNQLKSRTYLLNNF